MCTVSAFQLSCRKSGVPREIYKISGKAKKRQKIDATPPRFIPRSKGLTRHIPTCPRMEFQNFDPGGWGSCFSNYPITKLLNYQYRSAYPPRFIPRSKGLTQAHPKPCRFMLLFLSIPFLLICVYLRLSAAKGFAFFRSVSSVLISGKPWFCRCFCQQLAASS
jgi:hypothetical protein